VALIKTQERSLKKLQLDLYSNESDDWFLIFPNLKELRLEEFDLSFYHGESDLLWEFLRQNEPTLKSLLLNYVFFLITSASCFRSVTIVGSTKNPGPIDATNERQEEEAIDKESCISIECDYEVVELICDNEDAINKQFKCKLKCSNASSTNIEIRVGGIEAHDEYVAAFLAIRGIISDFQGTTCSCAELSPR
jgi:hypothetical protein